MLGTIVNTGSIIAGTLIGSYCRKNISEKYRAAIFDAMGLATLAIGMNNALSHLPKSQYPVLFIVSIVIGSLLGTIADLDGRFIRFVDRFSPPNAEDKKSGGSLAQGLITAVLLFCIGALSILGPVLSALHGDNTLLYTNATLDFITSIMFASAYGIGMIFSAAILFLWQGGIYAAVTIFGADFLSEPLICEISIVGGLMILASGLNLLHLKEIKTLNILPAIFVPPLYFAARWLLGI